MHPRRRALIVVGKAPRAGSTKTRLIAPPFSAQDAADLYCGFLLDAVGLGLELGWERLTVVHPQAAGPALRDLVPRQACLLEQRDHGLEDALSYAFEMHFAEGFDRIVLIGSDNPTLPVEPVKEACAALDAYDVSIGPSADGGYYLLGLRQPHLGIFTGIDWSTSRVFHQTLTRARQLGLRVHAVREWYDVDAPADLERLRLELASSSSKIAPNTRAVLGRLTSSASVR